MKKIFTFLFLAISFSNFILTNASEDNLVAPNEDFPINQLNQILADNQERINRAIELCENMEEDILSFIQKASDLQKEHYDFISKNNTLLNKYSDYRNKIDMQWMNALCKIYQSIGQNNDILKNKKKVIAIKMIAREIGRNLIGL